MMMMELKCKQAKDAHWGSILTIGKYYKFVEAPRLYTTTLIVDYENYIRYTKIISSSIDWVRKGYDQGNLHEVIPGYLTIKERNALYTKEVEILLYSVRTDDNVSASYCATTKQELIDKYGSYNFDTTIYFVEDYFDTTAELREKAINKIIE